MKRRIFLSTGALGFAGLALPLHSCFRQDSGEMGTMVPKDYRLLLQDLLRVWCDGMLRVQIHDPDHPELHGALGCPACNKIHGRCMDAVYPFLYMAEST